MSGQVKGRQIGFLHRTVVPVAEDADPKTHEWKAKVYLRICDALDSGQTNEVQDIIKDTGLKGFPILFRAKFFDLHRDYILVIINLYKT